MQDYSGDGGGAVQVSGTLSATLTIENCDFTSNTADAAADYYKQVSSCCEVPTIGLLPPALEDPAGLTRLVGKPLRSSIYPPRLVKIATELYSVQGSTPHLTEPCR